MTKNDYIRFLRTFPDVSVDNPFDGTSVGAAGILVARHAENRKWFAIIFDRNGEQFIDLKCDPPYAEYLREHERGVREGYHMNKRHWITADLGETADVAIKELTNLSFWLTAPKRRRKQGGQEKNA